MSEPHEHGAFRDAGARREERMSAPRRHGARHDGAEANGGRA